MRFDIWSFAVANEAHVIIVLRWLVPYVIHFIYVFVVIVNYLYSVNLSYSRVIFVFKVVIVVVEKQGPISNATAQLLYSLVAPQNKYYTRNQEGKDEHFHQIAIVSITSGFYSSLKRLWVVYVGSVIRTTRHLSILYYTCRHYHCWLS